MTAALVVQEPPVSGRSPFRSPSLKLLAARVIVDGRGESETERALGLLHATILGEFVRPALSARDENGFFRALYARWDDLNDALDAFATISRLVQGPPAPTKSPADERLIAKVAREVTGDESAAGDMLFASQTASSAQALARALRPKAGLSAAEQVRDASLSSHYVANMALHVVGLLCLGQIHHSPHDATPAAVSATFKAIRGGALAAYAAVREAIALRSSEGPVGPDVEVTDEEMERL
jgi:hypothetical protein